MKLTDIEIGYIAGIIDGEGSIMLSFQKHKYNLGYMICKRIKVENTNLQLLEWLKKKLGGCIPASSVVRPNHLGNKEIWQYYLCRTNDILDLLELVLPYLIVKYEHAKIMIEYCRLRKSKGREPYGEAEFDLANRLRVLNGRREKVIPNPQPKKKQIAWNKGKSNIYSEETLRRISEANKGKHFSPETEFKKGHIPWNKRGI